MGGKTEAVGSFLSFLRRPAVRIPLLLALMLAAGAWAANSYREQMRQQNLGVRRHLRFMEIVSRAAREAALAGRNPKNLAELARPSESAPGAIDALYRRKYAIFDEFALVPGTDPQTLGVQVRGEELAWESYCYRLWPDPAGGREFVIFAWPEAPGAERVTEAFTSTEPGALYYTLAIRYAGANGGPRPADLGDPFAGKINVAGELPVNSSPEAFLKKLAQSGGKTWARMDVKRGR